MLHPSFDISEAGGEGREEGEIGDGSEFVQCVRIFFYNIDSL